MRPNATPGRAIEQSTNRQNGFTKSRNHDITNGRELFFFGYSDRRIMVTDYTATGNSFSSTKVRVWSDRQVRTVGSYLGYALAPDGKRFAVSRCPNRERLVRAASWHDSKVHIDRAVGR